MNKVGINLSSLDNINQSRIIQIFTHNNKDLSIKWSENDIRNMKENTDKIYVHSIFKVVLGNSFTFKLFNDHFSYCCNNGFNGYVIHLPKEYNKNIINFIIKMFNLFKNMDTNYSGQVVYFEHVPSEYFCNPNKLKKFITLLKKLLIKYKIDINIGICIDTCHLYAAGYDLHNKEVVKRYFDEIGTIKKQDIDIIIHLNDSVFDKETFRDQHADIGTKIWFNEQSGLKYILSLEYDKIIELKDCTTSLDFIGKLIDK